MEAKGIRTNVGDLNRRIRATNAAIQRLRKKIAELLSWLGEVKEELSAPQSPKLTDILAAYYGQRNAGAWSNKAKSGNLKQYAETVTFLMEKKLYTVDDLEAYVSGLSGKMDGLKAEINQAKTRSKAIQDLLNFSQMYVDTKSIYDQMNGIKFKSRREKYKAEHDNELRRFYLARRKLKDYFSEDGKLPISTWRRELAGLEQSVQRISAERRPLWEEWKKLSSIKAGVHNTLRQTELTPRKQREQGR
jgi:septal ring factor EnvC (AmiA/AmiB activator)